MKAARLIAIAAVFAACILPGALFAQPGIDERVSSEYSQDQSGRWENDRGDRDRWDDDRWDNDRDSRHSWRQGSVSVRNSRSRSVAVQLRDSRGVVKSSFWLSPGERRYVRTSASSRWSLGVKQYRTYRRYTLDEIGSFDDGRWNVRIR